MFLGLGIIIASAVIFYNYVFDSNVNINIIDFNPIIDWNAISQNPVFIILAFIGSLASILGLVAIFRPSGRDFFRNDHFRHLLIDRVKTNWVDTLLTNSLFDVNNIELYFDECRDKVDSRNNSGVRKPNCAPRDLPSSTWILDLYNNLRGSFLILGQPGSGKTTLLLQLANKLLDQADADDSLPIPVVFNLSTWSMKKLPLEEWLIDDLQLQYGISKQLSKIWLNNNSISLLLDGLDEVASEHRQKCVEAINQFRCQYGLVPLVVCSRVEEYDALETRLNLPTAILVKPLTKKQIRNYLNKIGAPMDGVRVVLQEDKVLCELLDAPFMLNIVTLAFKDKPPEHIRGMGTIDERRKQLFDAYRDAMFKRPLRSDVGQKCIFNEYIDIIFTRLLRIRAKKDCESKKYNYTQEQAEHWLSWLARSMKMGNKSIFYLEQMDFYDWLLPRQWDIIYPRIDILIPIILGLFLGLLLGLADFLYTGLEKAVISFLVFGVAFTLAFFLFSISLFHFDVDNIAKLHVVSLRNLLPCLVTGVIAKRSEIFISGYLIFLISILSLTVSSYVQGDLVWMDILSLSILLWAVSSIFMAIIFGLDSVIEREYIYKFKYPNEGMRRSATYALILGPFIGLIIGIFFALISQNIRTDIFLIVASMAFGIASGMYFGGFKCILHYSLRFVLMRNDLAPWNYVKFLDYAADRIFLRKIGGGYAFIHGMIMDYFALLEADAIKIKLKAIEASLTKEMPFDFWYLVEEGQMSIVLGRNDKYYCTKTSAHEYLYLVKTKDNKIYLNVSRRTTLISFLDAPPDILISINDYKLREFLNAIQDEMKSRAMP